MKFEKKNASDTVALIQADGVEEDKHDEARSRFSYLFCESA